MVRPKNANLAQIHFCSTYSVCSLTTPSICSAHAVWSSSSAAVLVICYRPLFTALKVVWPHVRKKHTSCLLALEQHTWHAGNNNLVGVRVARVALTKSGCTVNTRSMQKNNQGLCAGASFGASGVFDQFPLYHHQSGISSSCPPPKATLLCKIVSVLWQEEGYTVKFSLSPREIIIFQEI